MTHVVLTCFGLGELVEHQICMYYKYKHWRKAQLCSTRFDTQPVSVLTL